ncbi:MAG: response regulator [Bacteroidetes bacterium]|nr:response regulator [Bacteroidota bacterium]
MSEKITVMLVDDNKIDLFIHNEFIKQMNIAHTVLDYSFATEALKFLEESDESLWPQLILLDIHMPIMNGFDFLEKYVELPAQRREKCHIVIVSSSLDTGDKMRAKESPHVLALIEKPLNTEKLKILLKENKIIS